jgi:hypothetical protein
MPFLIGTPVTTSIAANSVQLAPEASAALIRAFVPGASTDLINPPSQVRHRRVAPVVVDGVGLQVQ